METRLMMTETESKTALQLYRDEIAARLERTRARRMFGMTIAELERALDIIERAIIAHAIGEAMHADYELGLVPAWLRCGRWHAARATATREAETIGSYVDVQA